MMAIFKRISFNSFLEGNLCLRSHLITRGLQNFKPPPNFDHIKLPENRKLRPVPKVPSYPHGVKPPKMMKMLHLMRNPEPVHNKLIYKQFGIQCVRGGRLKVCHFDMIRVFLSKRVDYDKMFVIWRVDAPWQACTKRPIGFTLGGGKGHIHHYVTPVSATRMIIEMGGHAEYSEVRSMLESLAEKMPFKARAVSQEMLLEEERCEAEKKIQNMNPYTYEYMIKNNMLDCRKWIKLIDFKHFGKYPS